MERDVELGPVGNTDPERDASDLRHQQRDTASAQPAEYLPVLLKFLYPLLLLVLGFCTLMAVSTVLFFLAAWLLRLVEHVQQADIKQSDGSLYLNSSLHLQPILVNETAPVVWIPELSSTLGLLSSTSTKIAKLDVRALSLAEIDIASDSTGKHKGKKSLPLYHHVYPIHEARPVDASLLLKYSNSLKECAIHLLHNSQRGNLQSTNSLEFVLHTCKSVIEGAIQDLYVGTPQTRQIATSSSVEANLPVPFHPTSTNVPRDSISTSNTLQTQTTSSRKPLYTPNWFTSRNCTPEVYCGWVDKPNGLDRCMYRNQSQTKDSKDDDYVNKTADDFKHHAPEECNFCLPEVSLDDLEQYCVDVTNRELQLFKKVVFVAGAIFTVTLLGMIARKLKHQWDAAKYRRNAFYRPAGGMGFDGTNDDDSMSLRGMLQDESEHQTPPNRSLWKKLVFKNFRSSTNLPPKGSLYDRSETVLGDSTNLKRRGMQKLLSNLVRPRDDCAQPVKSIDGALPIVPARKSSAENRVPVLLTAARQAESAPRISKLPRNATKADLVDAEKIETSKKLHRVPVLPHATGLNQRHGVSRPRRASRQVQTLPRSDEGSSPFADEYEAHRRSLVLSIQKTPPEMYRQGEK